MEPFFEKILPLVDELTLIHLKIQQIKKRNPNVGELHALSQEYRRKADELLAKIVAENAERINPLLN